MFGNRINIFTDGDMTTHSSARKLMLIGAPMDRMMEVLGKEPEHHSIARYTSRS